MAVKKFEAPGARAEAKRENKSWYQREWIGKRSLRVRGKWTKNKEAWQQIWEWN
tara:strand:- start:2365 stop:2526 length:162 start_codon:yes stop_codon:yes gene_type:complete